MSAGRSVPDPADTGNRGVHDVRLFGSWLRFRMVVSLIGYATLKRVRAMSTSSDDELDDFSNPFSAGTCSAPLQARQAAHALLEVKSPNVPTAIYEARLRGYDWAAAKDKERS